MNKWLSHQNGFTRTSLSATVTQVSNIVGNVFLFITSRLPVQVHSVNHFQEV